MDDDYLVRKLTAADLHQVLTFQLDEYLRTMTLSQALDLQPEEAREYFEGALIPMLEQSYSFAAYHAGHLVAIRLAMVVNRGSEINQLAYGAPASNWKTRAMQQLQMRVKDKMWDVLPADVGRILSGSAVGVLSSHGRRGLAQRLTDCSLAAGRAAGCQGTVEMPTSFQAQRLFNKLGYEVIYSLDYANWRDESGNAIFNPSDGTKAIKLVFKRFV